ncbi:hypothetical protein ACFLQ5_00205 [Bacteroidota bacterium]
MKKIKWTITLMSIVMLIIFMSLTNLSICENSSTENCQTNPDSIVITGNQNWQLIKTTSQVQIFAKEVSCIDAVNGISMKKVLLKIDNLTSSAINVSWDNKLYYNSICRTCTGNPAENHIAVYIPANSLVAGLCSGVNPKLTLFIEMIGMQSESLTSFELTNLSIY